MTTAPSPDRRRDADFADVECPDCGTRDVTVVSLFGSSTSEVLFQCAHCHSCFNWIKWRHQLPPLPARAVLGTAD